LGALAYKDSIAIGINQSLPASVVEGSEILTFDTEFISGISITPI